MFFSITLKVVNKLPLDYSISLSPL